MTEFLRQLGRPLNVMHSRFSGSLNWKPAASARTRRGIPGGDRNTIVRQPRNPTVYPAGHSVTTKHGHIFGAVAQRCGPLLVTSNHDKANPQVETQLQAIPRIIGLAHAASQLVSNPAGKPAGLFTSLHNMALNLAPSGRWTLRDKTAQRRLALR